VSQPTEDSPRQRLLTAGPRALTDSELLTLLIQGRSPEDAARQRAVETLRSVGGLVGLQGLDLLHLRAGGVPQTGACILVAALELACRLVERRVPHKAPMTQPNRVADYLFLRYYKPDQEVLGALFLDGRYHLIGEEILASGSMTRVVVEPRTVLKAALLHGAASLIAFHTHPGGEPVPSLDDVGFTRHLRSGGTVLGIRIIDHMIIGAEGQWLSMQQRRGIR
jgi:DNA repair protein RadC